MPNPVEVIDGMERGIARLRAAEGSPAWRDAVIDSAVVLSRGMATLLESLHPSDAITPNERLLRAQKYARVKVAQIQLYAAKQVEAGRAARDLYSVLRAPIDDARSGFAEEFLTPPDGIPDYLHRELVRVLAQDDQALLGPDYPGEFK